MCRLPLKLNKSLWPLLLLSLALSASSGCFAEKAPEVTKVEPPNWWAGHSLNPVRVMIRGNNLSGARVEADGTGITIGKQVLVNAAGTYLFVDVSISATAKPGSRKLRIVTGAGNVDASFEISAPLASKGRFSGLATDDVLYLIMPDRFANGDTSNDDPQKSRGLFDRSKSRYYHGGDLRGVINHLPYL